MILVDFSTKTIKDLLHYANTRDPQVQSKALDELINRWTSLDAPHQEEYTGEIKGVGGLRILMNLASDNKSSVAPDVVAYQGKLMKLLSLLTENSMLFSLCPIIFSMSYFPFLKAQLGIKYGKLVTFLHLFKYLVLGYQICCLRRN